MHSEQKNLNLKIRKEKKKTLQKSKLKNEEESRNEQSSSEIQWKGLSLLESMRGLTSTVEIKLKLWALKRA